MYTQYGNIELFIVLCRLQTMTQTSIYYCLSVHRHRILFIDY